MAGKRIVALGLLALVALTLGLFASSGTEAGTYKPTNLYTIATNTANVASDNTLQVIIPSPNYNYEDSSMYNFAPIAWQSTAGAAFPTGAYMGTLSSSTTLGLLNSACNQVITPFFDLYNATLDTTDTLTPLEMAWTNTATPPPTAKGNTDMPDYMEYYPTFLNTMLDPDGPTGIKPPLVPYARFAGHGLVSTSYMLIEVVVLSPGQIAQLPSIKAQMGPELGWALLTVLNNPVDQIEAPGAVSDFCTTLNSSTTLFGTTKVHPAPIPAWGVVGAVATKLTAACGPSGVPVTCNVVSNAGFVAGNANVGPPSQEVANITALPVGGTQITFASLANAHGINDPITQGIDSQINPPDNSGVLGTDTHLTRTYSQGERDFDNDGWENDMDPCFYIANAGWDPRVSPPVGCTSPGKPGDTDCDGLPDVCDPDPTGVGSGIAYACPGTQADCDNDGYNNQQDICPLVADGVALGPLNQLDSDGLVENADKGPKPDSIGDACDDSDNDGKENGTSTGVAGSGNCRDGIDNDADTLPDMLDPQCLVWTDKGELGSCSNAVDDDTDTWMNDGCPAVGAREVQATQCHDNIDQDGDGYINDGCDAQGASEAGLTPAPASVWGTNPGTGLYFHAMPWAAVCVGDTDTDGDGYCNNLECVGTYPASCTSGLVSNPANANSKPESLVIDAWISGVGANVKPTARVLQSCTDGVDNDSDTRIDLYDNGALGCDPTVASYAGDADRDGVPDATDNCGSLCQIPNPEQHDTDLDGKGDACDGDIDGDTVIDLDMTTDTDADTVVDRCDNCPNDNSSTDQTDLDFDRQGNVCDADDDGDGFTDVIEAYLGTLPLDACSNTTSNDAWPLDMNKNKNINVVNDVLVYSGKIGWTVLAHPEVKRLDLDGNGAINVVGDVLLYSGKIGANCN